MATFKEALQYAASNPNSDFARQFGIEVATGKHDQEAKSFGIDTSPIKQKFTPILQAQQEIQKPQESLMEKISGFTGGKQIGQGLGQAIANPEISKQITETQKTQSDIQGQLLTKIKENKSLGLDTSKLENALKLLNEDIQNTGNNAGELMNQKGITTKQVIGDALQLGTTVLGAGELPGVAKSATGATGVIEGAKQGAIQGAKAGGIYGASSGASDALKQDKSLTDVGLETLKGGATGALTGGALGGVIGGVSGGLKQRAVNKIQKEKDFTLDLVSPKATEQVKQQALKEGRVTEQGLLSASKITPSKRDIQLADAVDGVISSKKSVVQNMDSISKKVQDINTGVKAFVKEKKVPFNTSQLRSKLNEGKSELDLIFASDKNAEKTYNAVTNKFIELVKNKDTAGLLDARQDFDKIPAVKKLLESDKLGENARKEIVSTVRTMANKYVSDLLPVGNKYRDAILKESHMIEALQNIADKNTGIIGVNKLQAFSKKYPIIAGAIGGAGATLLGLKAVGVGKSIIGSTD